MSPWELPTTAAIGGRLYHLHTDYRDVLEIFRYLDDPDKPEQLRWRIALALFYEETLPPENWQAAMEYLAAFLRGGQQEASPGPKLLDWQQDAQLIVADINKTAGQEIRAMPYLHWWSFLSWFHAIGEGQLSTVVSIRDKLRRGKKLESWEQDYYRKNKKRVDLPKRYSPAEQAQLERLRQRLG